MLIGSRALHEHVPTFSLRDGADWDIIGVGEHSLEHLNNREMVERYDDDGTCSLNGLAIIKRSHLWRDWFWDKHITMYHKHIVPNLEGISFSHEDLEVLKRRTKLTHRTYPQRSPSLNMTTDEFFDDAVIKKYDHDYLHELVAYPSRPLYERLKTQGNEDNVWCEQNLWNLLEYKAECVYEEASVIALERFLIPSGFKHSPRLAYYKAVKKICTTLTSGWFRDYAIDNFPAIMRLYDENKLTTIGKKLGEI